MGPKNVVAERDKCLIRAFSAFDFRLAADASDPLISTHRRVASLSAPCILPSARKHLLAPSEQVPEKRYLLRSRRGRCHPGGGARGLPGRFPDLRMFEHTQSVGDLRPFPIKCGQSIFQDRNFSSDVVRTGDGIMPFREPSRRLSANKRYDRMHDEYQRPRRGLWLRQSRNASYSAVFPTLSRVAASRTVNPLPMMARARSSFSSVTTGLRPPFRPRAAAATRPARVRS